MKFRKSLSKEDRKFLRAIKIITGKNPKNLAIYKLAMKHISASSVNKYGIRESNERLEYLGDAILGMLVAEFLFKKFPFKEEGFLTNLRSKIVNRESLNQVSKKIGLDNLILYHSTDISFSSKSIYGNSLEALIGAVYLDKGFKSCKRFIIEKLIIPHYNINQLINTVTNHKSQLIEWAQKENKMLHFEIIEVNKSKKTNYFTAQVIIDNLPMEKGNGPSKKKAEQDAAKQTMKQIDHVSEK